MVIVEPMLPSAWLMAMAMRVDGRRLLVAGDDDARAAVGLQVARRARRSSRRDRGARRPTSGDRARVRLDLRRRTGQAVIGDRAGAGGAGLDRVQAVDRRRPLAHFAAAGEVARVAEVAGAAIEEVGVERDDDVRFVEVIDGVRVAAERQPQSFAHVVAAGRLPLMPLRAGRLRQELLDLRAERRRGDGLRQEAQPTPPPLSAGASVARNSLQVEISPRWRTTWERSGS